jgi:hypothetical protein
LLARRLRMRVFVSKKRSSVISANFTAILNTKH